MCYIAYLPATYISIISIMKEYLKVDVSKSRYIKQYVYKSRCILHHTWHPSSKTYLFWKYPQIPIDFWSRNIEMKRDGYFCRLLSFLLSICTTSMINCRNSGTKILIQFYLFYWWHLVKTLKQETFCKSKSAIVFDCLTFFDLAFMNNSHDNVFFRFNINLYELVFPLVIWFYFKDILIVTIRQTSGWIQKWSPVNGSRWPDLLGIDLHDTFYLFLGFLVFSYIKSISMYVSHFSKIKN